MRILSMGPAHRNVMRQAFACRLSRGTGVTASPTMRWGSRGRGGKVAEDFRVWVVVTRSAPLFDQGYLTVTPDYCVRVSHRLKKDFDNGEQYYRHDGSQLWRPDRPEDRPNREFLQWHTDTVFRGSPHVTHQSIA